MNCSMVVVFQFRRWNDSVFSRPKKPSHAALSREQPLRDIERMSFACAIRESQLGQRSWAPRTEWATGWSLVSTTVSMAASSMY